MTNPNSQARFNDTIDDLKKLFVPDKAVTINLLFSQLHQLSDKNGIIALVNVLDDICCEIKFASPESVPSDVAKKSILIRSITCLDWKQDLVSHNTQDGHTYSDICDYIFQLAKTNPVLDGKSISLIKSASNTTTTSAAFDVYSAQLNYYAPTHYPQYTEEDFTQDNAFVFAANSGSNCHSCWNCHEASHFEYNCSSLNCGCCHVKFTTMIAEGRHTQSRCKQKSSISFI